MSAVSNRLLADDERVTSPRHLDGPVEDFGLLGGAPQDVAEILCKAMAVRTGERVVEVRAAGAEQLPLADASCDAALSAFGVMYAPRPARAALELVRVVRPGGRIALASWTPCGFVGQLNRTISAALPARACVPTPFAWGTEAQIMRLFGHHAGDVRMARRKFVFRARTPATLLAELRRNHDPMRTAYAQLDAAGKQALTEALRELLWNFGRGLTGALTVPAEYLEVVMTRL